MDEINSQQKQIRDRKKKRELMKSNSNRSNEVTEQNFSYISMFYDVRLMIESIVFDLDILTDSISIFTCYALSQSKNFKNPNTAKEMDLYYNYSVRIFIASLIPRFNCYLFFGLRKLMKMGKCIVIGGQNSEELIKPDCFIFYPFYYLYLLSAYVYGISYHETSQNQMNKLREIYHNKKQAKHEFNLKQSLIEKESQEQHENEEQQKKEKENEQKQEIEKEPIDIELPQMMHMNTIQNNEDNFMMMMQCDAMDIQSKE